MLHIPKSLLRENRPRCRAGYEAISGTLNGALRTTLVIAPERMHCVQAWIVLWVPLGVLIRTRCRLGLNFRRVMPVILVPTPPRYFFLPRVVT